MHNQLKEFQKFQKRIADMLERIADPDHARCINKSSAEISKKHHYIPRYYINAFADANKEFFIYDKEKDIIRKNKNTSGGVFFEMHRNSLHLGEDEYLPIFEEFYCFVDNNFPVVLTLLQSDIKELPQADAGALMACMNIFILDLFLRNKNNDKFIDLLFERSEVQFGNLEAKSSDYLKNVPGIKQLFRAKLLEKYIGEFPKLAPKNITRMRVITFPDEQICIGDNPMLILNVDGTPEALFQSPLILPISNKKLYLRNVQRTKPLRYEDTILFNAWIIDQSSKLIACSNKKTLEDSIEAFHYIKRQDICDSILIGLFYDNNFNNCERKNTI